MIIPIRCFSCGNPIAQHWEKYIEEINKLGKRQNIIITNDISEEGKILDKIGIKRYCCRRMFLGQIDLINRITPSK